MATIYRRGSVWRAQVRKRGEVLTKTLDSEAEAVAWADAEEARIANGATAKQVKLLPSDASVADVFDRYAREVSPDKGGASREVGRLRAIALDLPMRAAEVDGAAIAEWRERRLMQVSPATVNRELNIIGAVFTRAIKEWRLPITVNPVHLIQRPPNPKHRRRRVSDAERAAIVEWLQWDGNTQPQTTNQWVAWAFVLALETMMRQGEILALAWPNVHLERKFCHLPRTKNGDSRNVPLSSRAVALFAMLDRSDGRVIKISQSSIKVQFQRAKRELGIKDLHFHDTRREAITRTAEKLTNIAELARASGHRGTRYLMVYYEPDVTDTADKLG